MKKTLLITILFLGMMNLQAQDIHFGARAAGSFTTFTASGDDVSDYNDISKGKTNFELGLVAEFMVSDNFAIAPELNYATSGDVLEDKDGDFKLNSTISTSYIQLPIMFKYYVNENISLNFGTQIGFLSSAQNTTKVTYNGETNTDVNDIKDNFNSNESGINFGASYKMENGLFFDFRYFIGTSELLTGTNDSNLKSSALKFGIGYYFN